MLATAASGTRRLRTLSRSARSSTASNRLRVEAALKEPLGRLLEGGGVGDSLQADQPSEVGVVDRVMCEPAVVEARELPEHHAGQELGLGELLGPELVAVRWEDLTGRLVGDRKDPARGLADGQSSEYEPRWTAVQTFSLEPEGPHSGSLVAYLCDTVPAQTVPGRNSVESRQDRLRDGRP